MTLVRRRKPTKRSSQACCQHGHAVFQTAQAARDRHAGPSTATLLDPAGRPPDFRWHCEKMASNSEAYPASARPLLKIQRTQQTQLTFGGLWCVSAVHKYCWHGQASSPASLGASSQHQHDLRQAEGSSSDSGAAALAACVSSSRIMSSSSSSTSAVVRPPAVMGAGLGGRDATPLTGLVVPVALVAALEAEALPRAGAFTTVLSFLRCPASCSSDSAGTMASPEDGSHHPVRFSTAILSKSCALSCPALRTR